MLLPMTTCYTNAGARKEPTWEPIPKQTNEVDLGI